MRVVGIDGTKEGWAAVVLEDGRFARDLLITPIQSSFRGLPGDIAVLAIDVPIGFGPRGADVEARKFLRGAAASTVFATPPREVLEKPYAAGLGISAQAHALGPRILHVTELAKTDDRIHEVHPEVSFRAMNDRQPLSYRKKSAGGALERIALLRRHGITIDALQETAIAPLDDVLDAAAAAWSAHRIALGVAETLPLSPERVDGKSVCIWY
jgi:predicted RNase H-like nuclease